MFKESQIGITSKIGVLADAGYRGRPRIHQNTTLPPRRSKHNPLTEEHRRENKELASKRIVIENVVCLLKRFKIIADRYRNRRKRFTLRFNLIAGFYNFELSS